MHRVLNRFMWVIIAIAFTAAANALPLEKLQLPQGYKIAVYASDVKNARQMVLGDKGTLFVGSRRAGVVNALLDTNNDHKIDQVIEIANGLNMPSGITFKEGDLYIGEVHQVIRFKNIESHLQSPGKPEVVVSDLPTDKHHGWKYLGFGPDNKLYVPVGAPCNICDANANYSSIFRYDLKTGKKETVARGVRNSVGFDWDPATGDFWFSDNGRDMMGDDIPPCEINHVTETGQHFGYPYFHGGDIADPEFGQGKNAEDYTAPALKIQAHSAPLGIHFYRGNMFPDLKGKLLIAEHGSWNRSKKVGYQVTVATVNGNNLVDHHPLVSGWLEANEQVWGRPADVTELPDGSLLISDDSANAIYRVTYQAN
ncbi:PQQ-dependent sugar dehydrogenase [Neptunicella marina]|uniref:PQQ-dependent sugar dehydrogenase n=1 Tax=Neptunicella marina TaxID=2125989 RepID=A0A8J6M8U6_9ALTE|nr:PQQ-dependent sugar dehydrogenase [Neptunicella marina]MBC3767886.1 PQQ-dependent sugar dehydrogenase [Neptunicella marina]